MKKDMPITVLKLPKKIINSLFYLGGIKTVGQLSETGEEKLLKIRGIGHKGIEQIKECLENLELED